MQAYAESNLHEFKYSSAVDTDIQTHDQLITQNLTKNTPTRDAQNDNLLSRYPFTRY